MWSCGCHSWDNFRLLIWHCTSCLWSKTTQQHPNLSAKVGKGPVGVPDSKGFWGRWEKATIASTIINHDLNIFKSWLPSDATCFPWAPAPKDLDRSIHMRKNRDPIEGQSLGLIIQGPSYQLTIISHVNKNKVPRPHQACSLSSPSSGAAWHQWTSSTAACSWRLRD